jgi:hypothetical protein
MYLEISNIAAALGKNPYESREKMLLTSWARHCPETVMKYLMDNKCILALAEDEETFSGLQKEVYSENLPKDFDVKDFKKIEDKIVQEYKKKRNNEQTQEELVKLKEYTKDLLKKNNGNLQEDKIIKKEEYTKGNDRMYYYEIAEDACIGGKNDASLGDILLEIKTRVKKVNVRRNDYDLYQLIGYLLATGLQKGKLVQIYNKEKFDSDIANEKEYGIIDITDGCWKDLSEEIKTGLKVYFDDLRTLIETSNFTYLAGVIPKPLRPIAKITEIDDKSCLCEENVKYKNLLRHVSKAIN